MDRGRGVDEVQLSSAIYAVRAMRLLEILVGHTLSHPTSAISILRRLKHNLNAEAIWLYGRSFEGIVLDGCEGEGERRRRWRKETRLSKRSRIELQLSFNISSAF